MKPGLRTLVESLLQAHPPRAGSLAITIFGDAIAPQGNEVWLGSLVEVMERFGLNARQIRTALFRLGREGWLSSIQAGRKRYLSYTEFGQCQYERVAERIYAATTPPWDGAWTLIMAAGLDVPVRDELKKQLGWQGFGTLGGGVLAHPQPNDEALRETLGALKVSDTVVVWRGSTEGDAAHDALARLVPEAWRLDELAADFVDFIVTFAAVLAALKREPVVDASDAFVVRTLLIHEYRRVLLKTTELPQDLLPKTWPGHEAREIATAIYRAVHAAAVAYAGEAMQNRGGDLLSPDAAYYERFGGLDVLPAKDSPASGLLRDSECHL